MVQRHYGRAPRILCYKTWWSPPGRLIKKPRGQPRKTPLQNLSTQLDYHFLFFSPLSYKTFCWWRQRERYKTYLTELVSQITKRPIRYKTWNATHLLPHLPQVFQVRCGAFSPVGSPAQRILCSSRLRGRF